ncbi:MAG: M55 family metallopeptidase [Candidatus Aminicenantes bacterium]|nr:M55 family metallopeptidase [Candidatus Aminicenantes bacterium]
MKKIFFILLVTGVLSLLLPSLIAQTKPVKIYLSVDMEGIWGVVHGNQVSADSPEYAAGRRWMVEDVNAVINGLLEAGVQEIVVNDSHGSMRNIPAHELNPKVTLISGSPKPLSMMEGIDESFSGVIFVGYHARAGSYASILDHTISGAAVYAIKINGQEMPELGINAAIAGYYRVPVIMLTGDAETCRQAKSILGEKLVTVTVKEGVGRYAARMLPRELVLKKLIEGARDAVKKISEFKPFLPSPPYDFELQLHNSNQAELGALIPLVKRIEPRTLKFQTKDYLEGFKLLRVLIALAAAS